MKELQFKNCNESYKLDVDGVKIKPYLTWDEFANIYKSVSAQDNAFMRNFSKVVEFAKVCTNIDFDGMSEKEIYDICAQLGLQFTFEVEIGERRVGDPSILVADSTKIKEKLGWMPVNSSLTNIVNTAWRWHLKLNFKNHHYFKD